MRIITIYLQLNVILLIIVHRGYAECHETASRPRDYPDIAFSIIHAQINRHTADAYDRRRPSVASRRRRGRYAPVAAFRRR